MDSAVHSFLRSSRLIRRLNELNVSDVQVPQRRFAESFGEFFNLSDAIVLSQVLEELSSVDFTSTGGSMLEIRDVFLDERAQLLDFIAKSFISGAVQATRKKIPTPAEYHAHCLYTGVYGASRSESPKNYDAAYEPYRDFYVARQGKLTVKIHHLQSQIAEAVAGISPELARLVFLDKGLGRVLSVSVRQLLEVVPVFLGKRFRHLLDEHWQELSDKPDVSDLTRWMSPGGWIWSFCEVMRASLLAELEFRLQPVLGLINALGEEPADEGVSY